MARRTLTPSRGRSGVGGLLRLVLALLVLLALAFYTVLNLGRFFEVEEVALPDLVGYQAEEAVQVLRNLGLEPRTFAESRPQAPMNTVTSQSPSAGAVVREGRSVGLGVNEASRLVSAPELAGSSEAQAGTLLESMALQIGEVSYVFADAPEGRVLEQRPAAGEALEPLSSIDLVVSRGPEIATVPVPDVRGMNVEAAKRRLQALGFTTVDTLASSVSFDRPFTVTDQMPQRGEEAPLSTRVTLFYALSTDTVVQVPDLAGLPLGRAQLLLRSSGLGLGGVSYLDDPAQPAGVLSSEPNGYALRGTPVAVVVNRAGSSEPLEPFADDPDAGRLEDFGLEPGLTDPTPNAIPAPTPDTGQPSQSGAQSQTADPLAEGGRTIRFDFDPRNLGMTGLQREAYKLTVVVQDERGERTVIDETVPAGQPVNTTVTVYGEALLQTYLNDIFFQAWNP